MDITPTIMVVDDSQINRELFKAILNAEGYRVICANSGPDARRLAAQKDPDLIFLDIMMAGENGFDTCVKLKQSPATSDIPVIFVSAVDDVESKVKGLSIGGVDYITKPFASAEVLARTRLHLNLKMAYRALVKVQSQKLNQIKDAQQAILVDPDDIPEALFAVHYAPMEEAGGDFYDVVQISKVIFGYFVGDISGHDLEASYLTSALKALISQNARPGHTPEVTMKMINRVLIGLMKNGQHLTGCYAYLNRFQTRLTIINAGHLPAIHIKSTGHGTLIEAAGDILGAFDNVVFEPEIVKVFPGDRFFLYSDGLIESCYEGVMSRKEGIERLLKACMATMDVPRDIAVKQIIENLFPADKPPGDDIVLLAVDC